MYGMHTDQATEPLIDFAIHHNIPFAVVPCCVFASETPGRKLRNGACVGSYEDFIMYLLEKDPGIEKVGLGFEGRNTVLFNR